jgi:hypothetical protein
MLPAHSEPASGIALLYSTLQTSPLRSTESVAQLRSCQRLVEPGQQRRHSTADFIADLADRLNRLASGV